MLLRPDDFEPLTEEWDAGEVQAAIARIVADVEAAHRREPLWPAPPDTPVAPGRPEPSLYAGAPETGVLFVAWALTERPDLTDDLHARVRANVDAHDLDELMWGTAGTLLIATEVFEPTGERRWREACYDSADALLATARRRRALDTAAVQGDEVPRAGARPRRQRPRAVGAAVFASDCLDARSRYLFLG